MFSTIIFFIYGFKTKVNIKYSHKHLFRLSENRTQNYFMLSLTEKDEISIFSNKSVGSNITPTKLLKLLVNDISSQLADISNMSFTSGVFPSALKIAKVVRIHKKD